MFSLFFSTDKLSDMTTFCHQRSVNLCSLLMTYIDGKRSAQFEHTLLVTETGCEVLTARTENSPPLFLDASKEGAQ